jgi:HEAT repeat protein
VKPLIAFLLKSKDRYIIKNISETLGKIGAPALAPLIDALVNKDHRKTVAMALSEIGNLSVGPLVVALNVVDKDLRIGAAVALGEMSEKRKFAVTVELRPDVDKQLYSKPQIVSSDAIVLDECGGWYNLNRMLIEENIPDAWIFAI